MNVIHRIFAVLLLGLAVAACQSPSRQSSLALEGDAAPSLPSPLLTADVVLLGEVHDNAAQHALRAHWLRELARQRRFTLVIEQLETARQSNIDQAQAARMTPRALAEQAGLRFEGWTWAYYEPYLALALEAGLPLAGANLGGPEVMAIARGQRPPPALLDAPGVDWGPADQAAMEQAIDDGHCRQLPRSAIGPMALAQRARDAGMAQALIDAHRRSGLPVVLLAGNGHVRLDIGVPRYLRAAWPQARVVSVGFEERRDESGQAQQVAATAGQRRLEEAGAASLTGEAGAAASAAARYDLRVVTAAQPRPDPCAAFRKPRH